MRIVALVAQHELVKFAGLESKIVRYKDVLPRLAEINDDLDWILARQVASGMAWNERSGDEGKRRRHGRYESD